MPEGVRIKDTDCLRCVDDNEGFEITDMISESKVNIKYI